MIKQLIALPPRVLLSVFIGYETALNIVLPQLRGFARQVFIDFINRDLKEVRHHSSGGSGESLVRFWLYTPNRMCSFRHSSFSTKEPETLRWIDAYGGNGCFYDIGANIGIYSLYYAKRHGGKVFSFEPSFFNLRQLAKNLSVNEMDDRITIIPSPLTEQTGIANFTNGSEDEGGALNAFGVDYGADGQPINSDIRYNVVGFCLDDLLKHGVIVEPPSLIKIDVDGIEHLILKGAQKTLASKTLKSILIEVNDDFKDQATQVKTILEKAGFELKEQNYNLISTHDQIWHNQVWVR